jgi:hypothetical protein
MGIPSSFQDEEIWDVFQTLRVWLISGCRSATKATGKDVGWFQPFKVSTSECRRSRFHFQIREGIIREATGLVMWR